MALTESRGHHAPSSLHSCHKIPTVGSDCETGGGGEHAGEEDRACSGPNGWGGGLSVWMTIE